MPNDEEQMAADQGLDVSGGTAGGAAAQEGSDQGVGVSGSEGPTSLDQAFRMLNQGNQGGAESAVESSGQDSQQQPASEQADDGGSGGSATASGGTAEQPAQVPQNQQSASAAAQQRQQQQQAAVTSQTMKKTLQQQAIQMAVDEAREHNVKLLTLNDLYQRDENTGQVTFINPDDERRPFSSRIEAQQFVDSFNRSVNDEIGAYARELYDQLLDAQSDVFDIVDFAQTYNSMSPQEQQTFEALLAPYEQKNELGQIVFPGADFEMLHRQALNLVAMSNASRAQQRTQQQRQQQQVPAQHRPATDMKSSGGTASAEQKPPRNLGEALRRVNEEKRSQKGSK